MGEGGKKRVQMRKEEGMGIEGEIRGIKRVVEPYGEGNDGGTGII